MGNTFGSVTEYIVLGVGTGGLTWLGLVGYVVEWDPPARTGSGFLPLLKG